MTDTIRKTFLAGIVVMMPVAALAKGTITGQVNDKATGDPVDFATVQLIDASTGKALTIGTQTGLDGRFTLPDVPDGKYMVKVTNFGSIEQERPATVSDNDIDLGIITLADDSKMLQEVVVEGIRGQMRFELDKKVFNVDTNIAAAGASASELLEAIPSVEVDQDGEVSLRGNSSVTVWLNGKDSGLTADNRAQILEQIPAETIEKIEVITNPSAKYSPEGTAGIINIVLKKDRRLGYFGSAEVGGNTRGGANASVNINVNSGKFDSYASVGYRHRQNKGGSESLRKYDNGNFLNSHGVNHNNNNNVFVRAGITWHATKKDDIYANAFGMFGHRRQRSEVNYDSDLPGQWIHNTNNNRTSSDMRGTHVEMGYTHNFSDTHNIDMNVAYNHWGGPGWETYEQHQEYPDGIADVDVFQRQTREMSTNGIEAKVDYTNQLTDWLKLEAGYNGDYNHENSPVTTWSGTSPQDATIDEKLYNRFIYTNNVSALYATLGGKVKDFSFSAGLRAEAWQIRTRSLAYGQQKEDVELFKRNKFALFPSLFLSYSLPYDNEVQINYTRRIRRPWGGQLNSFMQISDPVNISYGNPELQPSYTNAFELNWLKSWTNHMISLSAYVRTSSDLMERISYLDGNVMYTTWANVSKSTNSGAEIVVKNRFFKIWDLTTTVNLYNSHMAAWSTDFEHEGNQYPVSGPKKDSFAWDLSCMASIKLPWGLSFQATGRYNSRQLTAQGSREPGWNVDAGLRKNLGNWSFSLNCRDIFDSRRMHFFTNGADYTQESKRWRGGRTLRLTVKYSFGNMKAKMPRKNQITGEPMNESGYGGEEF